MGRGKWDYMDIILVDDAGGCGGDKISLGHWYKFNIDDAYKYLLQSVDNDPYQFAQFELTQIRFDSKERTIRVVFEK